MLAWFRRLFGGLGPNLYYPHGLRPPSFFNCGVRTQRQVWDAIEGQVGLKGIGPFADTDFQVTTKDALENYATWWINHNYWMRGDPWRDCDNFAAAFVGDLSKWPGWCAIPKAVVWSNLYGGHAYNYVIALDSLETQILRVYFIEPQSGEVYEMAAEHFEEFGPATIMIQ